MLVHEHGGACVCERPLSLCFSPNACMARNGYLAQAGAMIEKKLRDKIEQLIDRAPTYADAPIQTHPALAG